MVFLFGSPLGAWQKGDQKLGGSQPSREPFSFLVFLPAISISPTKS